MFLEKIRDEEYFTGFRTVIRTVARCKCGAEIWLVDPMDNECDECGRLYNMSGQEVNCRARDIDPLDAGERYDEDDYFSIGDGWD